MVRSGVSRYGSGSKKAGRSAAKIILKRSMEDGYLPI